MTYSFRQLAVRVRFLPASPVLPSPLPILVPNPLGVSQPLYPPSSVLNSCPLFQSVLRLKDPIHSDFSGFLPRPRCPVRVCGKRGSICSSDVLRVPPTGPDATNSTSEFQESRGHSYLIYCYSPGASQDLRHTLIKYVLSVRYWRSCACEGACVPAQQQGAREEEEDCKSGCWLVLFPKHRPFLPL